MRDFFARIFLWALRGLRFIGSPSLVMPTVLSGLNEQIEPARFAELVCVCQHEWNVAHDQLSALQLFGERDLSGRKILCG